MAVHSIDIFIYGCDKKKVQFSSVVKGANSAQYLSSLAQVSDCYQQLSHSFNRFRQLLDNSIEV